MSINQLESISLGLLFIFAFVLLFGVFIVPKLNNKIIEIIIGPILSLLFISLCFVTVFIIIKQVL